MVAYRHSEAMARDHVHIFPDEVARPDFVEIGDEMMSEWSTSSCLPSRHQKAVRDGPGVGSRDDPHLASFGVEQLRNREAQLMEQLLSLIQLELKIQWIR
eukprot:Skav202593  [mRNA]  locus=scaffold1305:187300:190201:- [translate_table: standard]